MKATIMILVLAVMVLTIKCTKEDEKNVVSDVSVASTAVDSQGNLFVTGTFYKTVDFDPGKGEDRRSSNGEECSVYVTKLNTDGTYGWTITHTIVNCTNDHMDTLIDSQDNVFLVTLEQTRQKITDNSFKYITNALQITKYSNSGENLWTKRTTGSGSMENIHMRKDRQDNIYVSGRFSGSYNFNPDEAVETYTTEEGKAQTFIMKITNEGNYINTQLFQINFRTFMLDNNDSIVITGSQDSVIGGLSSWSNLIRKYDNNMNVQWELLHKNPYGLIGNIDSQNNILLGGILYDEQKYDFDPGTGVDEIYGCNSDTIYVTKFSTTGNYVTTNQVKYKAETFREITQLAVDKKDRVYVAGTFTGAISFNTANGEKNYTTSNSSIFLVRFAENGSIDMTKSINGLTNDAHPAFDQQNNIYLAGTYSGKTDFDPEKSHESHTIYGRGVCITKLAEDGSYVWTKLIKGVSDNIESVDK